jgi:rubrerythrin
MDFQQSKTYQNLLSAYQDELMSSTRYLIYGDTARLDGYNEIGNIFDTTAKNEKEHARIWLRQLNNGVLPDTQQNLLEASTKEANDGSIMYREYARIAKEEGYDDIAGLFNGVANIELNFDLQFRSLYEQVVRGEVFCKPEEQLWICMQCGNIMYGLCAPVVCPVCGFPQSYYRLFRNQEI